MKKRSTSFIITLIAIPSAVYLLISVKPSVVTKRLKLLKAAFNRPTYNLRNSETSYNPRYHEKMTLFDLRSIKS